VRTDISQRCTRRNLGYHAGHPGDGAGAARHPGVAVAIAAANLPDHKSALAAILLFVVVGMIVPIPYLRWIKPQIAEYAAVGEKP
jgi:hypothetical protein